MIRAVEPCQPPKANLMPVNVTFVLENFEADWFRLLTDVALDMREAHDFAA